MQSYKGRFEPTRFADLTVTVDFHCHSAYRFCIVQEGMNLYRGVPFERFQQAVDDNRHKPRYRRITFTGGEITLEKKLFEYVAYARERGGFEHIRLQTNGRLLADRAYAERLVEAGVDEFFVSLHGPNPEVQDFISQREGSFDEAWAGLENLHALGVTVLTNTVLITHNVPHLKALVEKVRAVRPTRMEFWNYLPMEDFEDERGLIAPMAELAPALREALAHAEASGIPCAVKYVPRCLLGEHGHCVDNTQPDVVIVEEFYDVYPKFACLWEAKCEHAETCLGLHHPYVHKHGWERELLTPTPRTTPWREPEDGLALGTDDPTRPGDGFEGAPPPPTHHPAWLRLVEGVAEEHGARLATILLDRRRCTYRFEAEGARVDLLLTKRDDGRPALLRTRSFNVAYRHLELGEGGAGKATLAAVIEAAARTLRERDRGDLLLDERKGLVGPEATRRRRRS